MPAFMLTSKTKAAMSSNWNLELASPNVLIRQGWTRHSLNVGDEVSVVGSQAKDGSNMANARTVTLADGRKVFAFSPTEQPPASTEQPPAK